MSNNYKDNAPISAKKFMEEFRRYQKGSVSRRHFLGEQTEYLVETDDLGDILIRASKHAESISGGFSPGDVVRVGWDDTSALAFEELFDRGRSPVGAASKNDDDGTANKGD